MKVWGVNETQLRVIADEVGVKLNELREDGRALRFTLRPTGDKINNNYKYQRISTSYFGNGRRVHAVCWHGHRDFMHAIFQREPNARIKTGWADYRGQDDFMEKFPATGHLNIGPPIAPVMACHACNCSSGDWLIDLSIYPNWQEYKIKQTTIQGCPFLIFTPDHYRADGSCKCDDPDERERMKREWEYTDEDFARKGLISHAGV